ncbi:MAG: peptide deformylase [Myxococcota bacterium]|jgi:peptide deformylase
MSLREVLEYPDARLTKKAVPVKAVNAAVRALLDDMVETMYASDGIGLAATQVGEPIRCLVVDVSCMEKDHKLYKVINPEVMGAEGSAIREEGCLSLPEVHEEVERPEKVRILFTNENGGQEVLECDGMLARAMQHEMDHLNGKLIFDHLSPLKRGLLKRKLAKAKRKKEKEQSADGE